MTRSIISIGTSDSVNDGAMLCPRFRKPIRAIQSQIPREGPPSSGNVIAQPGQATAIVKEEVEIFVALITSKRITLSASIVESVEDRLGLSQLVSRDPRGTAGNGESFGELPCHEQCPKPVEVHTCDSHAAVRFRRHYAFSVEDAQCFTNWSDRGTEPFGNLVLAQTLASFKLSGEDFPT